MEGLVQGDRCAFEDNLFDDGWLTATAAGEAGKLDNAYRRSQDA